jgi:hypothetical protein
VQIDFVAIPAPAVRLDSAVSHKSACAFREGDRETAPELMQRRQGGGGASAPANSAGSCDLCAATHNANRSIDGKHNLTRPFRAFPHGACSTIQRRSSALWLSTKNSAVPRFVCRDCRSSAIAGVSAIHFSDEAVESGDCLRDALMIRADYRAEILRIELGGERSRANEVGEHHSQPAALGVVSPSWLGLHGCRGCRYGNRSGA